MEIKENIINSLWIGKKLSPLELLTLHSFIAHGYSFHLWVYEDLDNDLPIGVTLRDANIILPENKIFRRSKAHSQKGFGKGSLALFADLFRFKLLAIYGGWWVDMDITCLNFLKTKDPYFFRAHPILPLVGNIIKCPPNAPLMIKAYEEAERQCNTNTSDWLLSNRILSDYVLQMNLSRFIKNDFSNPDDWLAIEQILYLSSSPKKYWSCIHWMNEVWRFRGMNKYQVVQNSYLHNLYQKYNIEVEAIPNSYLQTTKTQLKTCERSFKNNFKRLLGKG